MRALLVGALGLTLLGCSHSPPQLASAPPCDETGATICDEAAQSAKPHPAPSAVKRSLATGPSPAVQTAAAAKASAKVMTTAAGSVDAQADVAEPPAKTESAVARPATLRDAGRMVAATAEDHKDASAGNADAMMAVVMARPEIKSVAELARKTVAIDERYAQSNGKVRTAIAAAGATAVQLSEGRTTAMTRLGNGEVPAAVVALVTAEAAETFPAISGYRIFHVPLSSRAVKPAR